MISKRIFDKLLSLCILIVTFPLWIIIAFAIKLESQGPVIYLQNRVGKEKKIFTLYKFRSMCINSDKFGITIGNNDSRITRIGKIIRKYKLDELPQFINVIKGDLSIVGPRPDLPCYSQFYEALFDKYYTMKPGITCFSSLELSNEADLYLNVINPEEFYINVTIPRKVELDKRYFYEQSIKTDLLIIMMTVKKIFFKRSKSL